MEDILAGWGEQQRSTDDGIADDADRCGRHLIYSVPDTRAFDPGQARDFLTALHPGAAIS